MRQIYPPPSTSVDSTADLLAAYAYPDAHRWVRANMIGSLDGSAHGADGRSGSLGTDADRQVMALLRGLADVVLVGAGTARTEGYGPVDYVPEYAQIRLAEGRTPTCPIAIVSGGLDLEPSAPLFRAADPRTIVVTTETSPADRRAALEDVADVILAGSVSVDIPAALEALAARGLTRVLCEGGPGLLADMVRAGAVDELCLSISPTVVGGDWGRVLSSDAGQPTSWSLAHVIEDSSMLLTRWTRAYS